jgi:hypothetical protein
MADAFHYPPELFELLVETIARLSRGKKGVVLFLRGAGVANEDLAEVERTVSTVPDSINKFEIVRTVLTKVNARGDSGLRPRREIIKRVVEFESFATCWPEDQLKAKGLVASVREAVNAKDSFTRMKQERDTEREAIRARQNAEQVAASKRLSQIEDDLRRCLAWMISPMNAASCLRVFLTTCSGLTEFLSERTSAAKTPTRQLCSNRSMV